MCCQMYNINDDEFVVTPLRLAAPDNHFDSVLKI